MTFRFHLKLSQIKAISQNHCVVPYKAVTVTAGHDLGHLKLKVKGQYLTLEYQVSMNVSTTGKREFEISKLKD